MLVALIYTYGGSYSWAPDNVKYGVLGNDCIVLVVVYESRGWKIKPWWLLYVMEMVGKI